LVVRNSVSRFSFTTPGPQGRRGEPGGFDPSSVITDAQHGHRAGGLLHELATTSVAGFMSPAHAQSLVDNAAAIAALAAGLGTAAALNAPATGDAASSQVVIGSDSRLSDARTPTTHGHTDTEISSSGTGWVGATVNLVLGAIRSAYTSLSAALTAHTSDTSNPHGVTAAQIGVAPGATANSADAVLLARANHTGTQAIATVSGLQTALDAKAATSSLATVATSGAYADLSGKPSLATVATSGAYADLSGKPSLATVATSGAYSDLTGKPSLATVATSGSDADVSSTGTGWVGSTVRAILTLIKTTVDTNTSNIAANTTSIAALALTWGTPEVVATTTYTIVAADKWKRKRFTSATGCVVTVPSGIFSANGLEWVSIEQELTAGQVSVVGSTATVNSQGGCNAKTRAPGTKIMLAATETVNVADLFGDCEFT
jgi:hypothetical protein